MGLSLHRLHPSLGVRIDGVDLQEPQPPEVIRQIRQAFDDHIVVVFRDQNLSEDAHLRTAGFFGDVHVRRRRSETDARPGGFDTPFMLVSNIIQNGKPIGAVGDGEVFFHHDTSYYEKPHRATLLYSLLLPSWGGNTCFANMYAAYERIPASLRERLEGRRALQMHDQYNQTGRLDPDSPEARDLPKQWQPIFIRHPATGRRALFVSRLITYRIEGFGKAESDDILDQLFEISESPDIIYQHDWRLDDLVIWDNWCSIHARTDFPRNEGRKLRRVTTEGQVLTA